MNILETIRGLLQTRQAKDSATLGYLVEAVLSGHDITPAQVLSSLEKLGLTLADLEAACQMELKRRSLADRIEAGRLAEQELATIDGKIQGEFDEFQAQYRGLDAKYGPRITALRDRKILLESIRASGQQAQRDARDLAPPELKERVQELRREGVAMARRREALQDISLVRQGNLRRAQEKASEAETKEAREHYIAEAAQIEQMLAQIAEEREALAAQDRQRQAELARVEADMVALT